MKSLKEKEDLLMRCPVNRLSGYPTHPSPKRLFNRPTDRPANRLTIRGQSVLEYAIVLAVVAAAFLAMSLYLRRAVYGGLGLIDQRVASKDSSAPTYW